MTQIDLRGQLLSVIKKPGKPARVTLAISCSAEDLAVLNSMMYGSDPEQEPVFVSFVKFDEDEQEGVEAAKEGAD